MKGILKFFNYGSLFFYYNNNNNNKLIHFSNKINRRELPKIKYLKREYSTKIKSKIKNVSLNELKGINNVITGGYMSYKNIYPLGFLDELNNNEKLFKNKLIDFLSSLEDGKVYTMLSLLRWNDIESGNIKGLTTGVSVKISKDINVNILLKKLKLEIISTEMKYGISNQDCNVILISRVWYSMDDFNVLKNDVVKELNNVLSDSLPKDDSGKVYDIILNRINVGLLNEYTSVLMDNYGSKLNNGYYKYNEDECFEVISSVLDDKRVNVVNVKSLSNDNNTLFTWTDIETDKGFVRKIGVLSYYYINGVINHIEAEYNYPNIHCSELEMEYDEKIGAIDFETFGDGGWGEQNVYAGGWAINGMYKEFYIDEENINDGVIDENALINKIIESIFEEDIDKYTFYAHNLGRFDSLFLIKCLVSNNNFKIKPVWKDNSIISIVIKDIKRNKSIKLLDSLHLINAKLENILKDYNCENLKGNFPYWFITPDKLFYIGNKPDYKYYSKSMISKEDYDKIPNENWDTKNETLKYMKSDICGLLEVLNKISIRFYELFNINITSYPTLPGLSMAVFTSQMYDEKHELKIIKGNVEKDIRASYFGGNVGVYHNEMKGGFELDMNSQFSYAMLEDMPVGNPIFTTEKNLDNIFGYVYGVITAPSEDVLKIPYIQYRNNDGSVSTPRGSFSRWIYSEEIKQAINDGYSINIICGYKFNRGKDVFRVYVERFYEMKSNASNKVDRSIAKLMLNSLYGKFGMKDISSRLKIVNKNDADKIIKNYNYNIFSNLDNDKVLIRYTSRLSEKLRKIIKNNETGDDLGIIKNRGVPSSVQIASAVTANARSSINIYKNISGNTCYYSDTDSVFLEHKLEDKYIGNNIGQMKLVNEISEGLFVNKKLYAIKRTDDKVIIKASGADSNKLQWSDFKDLISGKDVKTKRISFQVDWSNLKITVTESKLTLKGLKK